MVTTHSILCTMIDINDVDPHLVALTECCSLKIAHLNTQSMLSSFEEFKVMLHTYPFDIICLTETWMTDNKHLLDYITIPGYAISYHNRTEKRDGSVGVYLNPKKVGGGRIPPPSGFSEITFFL